MRSSDKMGAATIANRLGAIWDLDGTIVDTQGHHFEAWRGLMRENGRALSFETFRPTFGLRNDDILINHFGFPPGDSIAPLAARKEELFLDSLARDGVRLQPGVDDLARHLHLLGFRQAIASSAPAQNIDFMVNRIPIGPLFDCTVSTEEIQHGKPAPDIVFKAAECLALPADQCVVFEDAPAGIEAGKAAGCKVIAVADLVRRQAAGARRPRRRLL